MPAIPQALLQQAIVNALGASGLSWTVPQQVTGAFSVSVTVGGSTQAFSIAVRTVTRDTRKGGKWVNRLKVQLTGLKGVKQLDGIFGVRLVGSNAVIVSIDPTRHIPVTGRSNNVQFPEQLVLTADQQQAFKTHSKKNGEVVEAFPDHELGPYLLRQRSITVPSMAAGVGAPPNQSATVPSAPTPGSQPQPSAGAATPTAAAHAPNVPAAAPVIYSGTGALRPGMVRVYDPVFSDGVKKSYGWTCAACGVSMGLVEAAHLEPFAVSKNNSTANGVCLCPNHHAAFDAELIAFGEDRTIFVNTAKLAALKKEGHDQGLAAIIGTLADKISDPGIDQAKYLKVRFQMDAAEGTWKQAASMPKLTVKKK